MIKPNFYVNLRLTLSVKPVMNKVRLNVTLTKPILKEIVKESLKNFEKKL